MGGARKVIVSCCSLGARISAAGSIAQLTSAGTHARRPADLVSAAPGREPALRPSATEAGEDSVSSSPLAQYGMFDRVELGGGRSGTCKCVCTWPPGGAVLAQVLWGYSGTGLLA